MKAKILFVDDEEMILHSLKRLLFKEPYDCYFANSGARGLELMEENNFCVIVSDMRMPKMDGVSFLKEARKKQPDAVRMVLSGYSEAETIMDAVNEGSIWRFIVKPWDKNEFRISISNALEIYEKEKQRKQLVVELNTLNQELEKKVQERTRQLNERSEILQMILEDNSASLILKRICSFLSEYSCHADVSIVDNSGRLITHSRDQSASPELLRNHQKIASAQTDGIPNGRKLIKGDEIMGTIMIKTPEPDEKSKENLKELASLAALVMYQEKVINDTPSLLDDIDRVMGEL